MKFLIKLLPVIFSVFILSGCDQPVEGLNVVGTIDIGPLAKNSLLAESCIGNIPYYMVVSTTRTGKPGSRGALAIRLNEDGSVPECGTAKGTPETVYVIKMDSPIKPNLELGDVCIEGVHYLVAVGTYTLGLTPAYTKNGEVGVCQ